MTRLERLLELLVAERDRRQKTGGNDSGARERFLEELAEIGLRLRAGPRYDVEPTPAEQAQSAQELDRWLDRWLRERQGRN